MSSPDLTKQTFGLQNSKRTDLIIYAGFCALAALSILFFWRPDQADINILRLLILGILGLLALRYCVLYSMRYEVDVMRLTERTIIWQRSILRSEIKKVKRTVLSKAGDFYLIYTSSHLSWRRFAISEFIEGVDDLLQTIITRARLRPVDSSCREDGRTASEFAWINGGYEKQCEGTAVQLSQTVVQTDALDISGDIVRLLTETKEYIDTGHFQKAEDFLSKIEQIDKNHRHAQDVVFFRDAIQRAKRNA